MEINKVKIVVGYIIDRPLLFEEEILQEKANIATFIDQIDYMYIYNRTSSNQNNFYSRLNNYVHIEYADCFGMGEAEIYAELIAKAKEKEANFVMYIKPGYYYEEDSFKGIKRYLLQSDTSQIAVLTPNPLLACEMFSRNPEEYRPIKGCRLIGALLNVDLYQYSNGIVTEYYQTTFDYDYCIEMRSKGYKIILSQNDVLRNQNYKVITRKFLLLNLSSYARDSLDVYYETRNRFYLWDKYKNIDPDYVKLDKKLSRREKSEMRFKDKSYPEKRKMIDQAIDDYNNGVKGQMK